MMKRKIPVHAGSDNIFLDMGLPDAAELPLQAELTRLIYRRIRELGLTQVEAGIRLGLKQPDVSKLMNARHSGFSAERLFRFLNALDQDIEIIISTRPPRSRRHAITHVKAA